MLAATYKSAAEFHKSEGRGQDSLGSSTAGGAPMIWPKPTLSDEIRRRRLISSCSKIQKFERALIAKPVATFAERALGWSDR
jgi:hypothetical protein